MTRSADCLQFFLAFRTAEFIVPVINQTAAVVTRLFSHFHLQRITSGGTHAKTACQSGESIPPALIFLADFIAHQDGDRFPDIAHGIETIISVQDE